MAAKFQVGTIELLCSLTYYVCEKIQWQNHFGKFSKIVGMWPKIYLIYFYFFRAPNGIQLVNDLIEDRTKYLPCGQFNKDNSCDLPFVHLNEKNENMIHSCALCYFVLSGLINVHLLRKCPLLSFIWNYTEK